MEVSETWYLHRVGGIKTLVSPFPHSDLLSLAKSKHKAEGKGAQVVQFTNYIASHGTEQKGKVQIELVGRVYGDSNME